ncbi:MAG TPA: hypothetical protein VJX28_05745 [Chthoniobacterales bacterium]|nr:hypothetical protein [Chthoniobacterales bacterium]
MRFKYHLLKPGSDCQILQFLQDGTANALSALSRFDGHIPNLAGVGGHPMKASDS